MWLLENFRLHIGLHLFTRFCQTGLDFILSDLPTKYISSGLKGGERSEREKPHLATLDLKIFCFSELLGACENFER